MTAVPGSAVSDSVDALRAAMVDEIREIGMITSEPVAAVHLLFGFRPPAPVSFRPGFPVTFSVAATVARAEGTACWTR